MTEVDDSDLLHARPYDPQKAREYYLRTRHLKGRQKGTVRRPSSGLKTGKPTITKTHHSGSAKAAASSNRAALESRLDHLRDVLAELVDAAKKRSGVDTKPAKKTATKKEPEKKSKLTAAEKAKKAKAEREKYKKNPPTPQDSIPELQAKIADIRKQIEQAIENNRRKKSTSKTAAKGR